MVWGDLVTKTGFERVNRSIFENLTDKLDIAGLGINYRGDPNSYRFPVYPASLGGDLYGIGRIKEFTHSDIDILFILNDAWVINQMLTIIKQIWPKDTLPKIVTYIPVDAEEHDPDWFQHFDIVSRVVAYTQFGKNVILKAAPELAEKLTVIPHGIDTKTFFKIDRKEARKAVFGNKATDNFIFLNANRNQPRKKIDLTLEGFKLFADGKPDVNIYMHCGITDMHIDVARLSVRLGIDDKLILSNVSVGPQQVSEKTLNIIYNSCNVGVNTGLGEGWGLTSTEHASTGALQIIPNHSACTELFKGCGVFIPVKTKWLHEGIMTVGGLVRAEDVASAMQMAYSQRELCDDLAEKAFNKFTAPEYQWSTISETWYKLFEELYD